MKTGYTPTMYEIVNVKSYSGGVEEAVRYIHEKWGNKNNYEFYLDAIIHSSSRRNGLPRFYVMHNGDEIIGCYALLSNDFISRHDLMPWFACLYIEKSARGNRLSMKMFEHAKREARNAGFQALYLTTDHEALYEKFGWERIEDGYDPAGNKTRIYKMSIK